MLSQNFTEESMHFRINDVRSIAYELIKSSPRPISTSQLTSIAGLTHLAYQPCDLQGVLLDYSMRDLILRLVSRLDAFSVYPSRT